MESSNSVSAKWGGSQLPVVNGDDGETTAASPSLSNPPLSQNDKTEDPASGTSLDDRIRFALQELDFHDSDHRIPNFRQPPMHNGNESESESSDSESGEACPNAMGYMPLPQEPDMGVDGYGSGDDDIQRVSPRQGARGEGWDNQRSCDYTRESDWTCGTPGGDVRSCGSTRESDQRSQKCEGPIESCDSRTYKSHETPGAAEGVSPVECHKITSASSLEDGM